jgi:CRP-like cAMP-binding protein
MYVSLEMRPRRVFLSIIERAAAVLSTIDKMLFLRRVSIFSSMTLEQLRVLASHLEEQHFLKGEVIIQEGDFSQDLYIVVTGRVRIVKDYGTPNARTLNNCGPGDFFGEMAIFEGAPRSATGVAETEAELLVLSPEKFKQTIYQKPDMAFEIFRELSFRLRRRETEVH